MVELAARNGLILACGHQERAQFEAMGLYAVPEKPLRLEAVRNGTASARNLDVSVVLDLMIHDIDLALSLAGVGGGGAGGPGEISHGRGLHGGGADEVFGRGRFRQRLQGGVYRLTHGGGTRANDASGLPVG